MAEYGTFIGSGWSFPVGANERGGIALSRGETDIRQAIRIILETPIGERRMRPTFGCGIHDRTFGGNDPTTHGLIRQDVLLALMLWEPRIEVHEHDVLVRQDPAAPSGVQIEINFRIRATNERRNLVYPFYLIPGE